MQKQEGQNIADFQIENGVFVKFYGDGGAFEVPESVTKIGDCAFFGCNSLNSIIYRKSTTSIGENAFEHCGELIIYAPVGSKAQAYAEKCGITFLPLAE